MQASGRTGGNLPTIIPRALSLLSVILCFEAIEWISSLRLLRGLIPIALSPLLASLFEHQVWQFGIGMLIITILSRGHLWSYGINSSSVRASMVALLRFYGVAAILMIALVVVPMFAYGSMPFYFERMPRRDMIGWILFQWMAAAVGNEVFFHGLCQTLLLKYWREKFVLWRVEVPFVVILTSVAFAAGRSNVSIYGDYGVEYLLAFLLGLFGGIVYFRTRSLLTPMLSQAFFYGLPFVLRYAYLTLAPR